MWDRALRYAGVKTSGHIKDLFDKYDEPEALNRLRDYYCSIDIQLEEGDFDNYLVAQGLDKLHLHKQIQVLLGDLGASLPSYLRVTPQEEVSATTAEVSSSFKANTPVQLLGPMKAWGGEIHIKGMALNTAKNLVEKTGQELGCRFPGYFREDNSGTIIYHISQYPRREGLEVPPLSEFRNSLASLYAAFVAVTDDVGMKEEQLQPDPRIRIILGLREGYFDRRKEDIEVKIETGIFSDLPEIKLAIADRLGDLSTHGIDVDSFTDPHELRRALQEVSLSILHEVSEVTGYLGTSATVHPAEIFSVAPDYTYSEEAVLIEVPADRKYFEKLVQLADAMKQARFTTERLDTGLVVNVEVKAFTQDRAAQMI